MDVFPTLEFPTRTILKRRSGGVTAPSSCGRTCGGITASSRLKVSADGLLRTHADAGLLAHWLTPRRRGGPRSLPGGGLRADVTHHQVYVFLARLAALLQGALGLAVEQVRQVVLLDGDDPLEVTMGGQVDWVGPPGGEGLRALVIVAADRTKRV